MSKAIRFSELIKRSGKPETVTLWTKPKDNPQLMKAVRENRALTVVQKVSGTADFGEIGFHQKPSALYLVFPKALPKITDSRVIGIKYDLLQEASAKLSISEAPRKKISEPLKVFTPPKPKAVPIKHFSVTILRTATQETKLNVKAQNLHEAESRALETVKAQEFAADEVQDEIEAIAEK
ncbi:MAG TPA: hypothetical protein VHY30_00450 [Verrucomicrobiae bacterium]|jgi:hypothetical protein|nr:hypothetical protein [Verrucomicrobiae bacterium]